MSSELPQSLFDLYRRAIEDYCGICLTDDHRSDLESKIRQRLDSLGLESPLQYLNRLTQSRAGHREWDDFIALIANNETFFFREPDQFDVLKERILPELVRLPRQIRVWSAGCSTGEEAYSLAITLYEGRMKYGEFEPTVVGTDIDQAALETARRGDYGKNSFRSVDPEIVNRYFIDGDDFAGMKKLDPRIRSITSFQYLNLLQASYGAEFTNFDIIFFRNVSIYFSKDTIERIHRRLMEALAEGGYLFVASSETLHHQSDVPPIEMDGVFVFRKDTHERKPMMKPVVRVVPKSTTKPHAPRTAIQGPTLEEIISAYQDGRYDEVLTLIQAVRSRQDVLRISVLKALVEVGQENWQESERTCDTMLSVDPVNGEAYLVKGLIAWYRGQHEDAESAFRKAIFLANNLAIAHFYLGKLLTDENRKDDGLRSFRNAIRVLREHADHSVTLIALGYSTETLHDACQHYLANGS